MAQRQYPQDYTDRPNRPRAREEQWQQEHNREYQAEGWAPDRDRDSALGEYYPPDDYRQEEDFFDRSEFTGARRPRSLAENRQTGYNDRYGEREYYNEQSYGGSRGGSSTEGYGAAYNDAARRRRAAILEQPDRLGQPGQQRGQGYGAGAPRGGSRPPQGRGDFYRGYAGPGYGDYNQDLQSNNQDLQSNNQDLQSNNQDLQGHQGAYNPGGFGGRSYGEHASDSGFGYGPQNREQQAYRGNAYRDTPNHRGRGPKNYQRSDTRIHDEICERLSDDPTVDASEVSISVESGVVRLEGSVQSRSMKHRAEDIAADCSGVKDIENRITLDTGSAPNRDRDATGRPS